MLVDVELASAGSGVERHWRRAAAAAAVAPGRPGGVAGLVGGGSAGGALQADELVAGRQEVRRRKVLGK